MNAHNTRDALFLVHKTLADGAIERINRAESGSCERNKARDEHSLAVHGMVTILNTPITFR